MAAKTDYAVLDGGSGRYRTRSSCDSDKQGNRKCVITLDLAPFVGRSIDWGVSSNIRVPRKGKERKGKERKGKERVSSDGRSIIFRADSYAGQVQDAGEYRDAVIMPFPYLQVDFRMHGATSGGPIISNGRVIGVNCTEYEPYDSEDKPLAFGSQIRCLRDAFLDDVIPINEKTPRRMSFDEFVRTGSIEVEHYPQRETSEPLSGSVTRLDLPYTARPPKISFEIYT